MILMARIKRHACGKQQKAPLTRGIFLFLGASLSALGSSLFYPVVGSVSAAEVQATVPSLSA
jgi:hypothetical protein